MAECGDDPDPYAELAHVVVPRKFYWEIVIPRKKIAERTEELRPRLAELDDSLPSHHGDGAYFAQGYRNQDIDALSFHLSELGVSHRKTDLVLEIKLY